VVSVKLTFPPVAPSGVTSGVTSSATQTPDAFAGLDAVTVEDGAGAFAYVIEVSVQVLAVPRTWNAGVLLLVSTRNVAFVTGPGGGGTVKRMYERMTGEPSTRIWLDVP
jgi:hypothetical protein